jgi:hypothetical protein
MIARGPVPISIGGATVICYSPIDERHRHTAKTKQIVSGVVQGAASGLAICEYSGEDSYYLFGCDSDWNSVTDTWHLSLEDAKLQADFEYEGVSETWQMP